MPIINAETLREHLERDLPGVLAPPPATARQEPAAEEEQKPKGKGKGKHAPAKPDFLTTDDAVVLAERLPEVATYLRDKLGYEYLSDIAVVDYLDDDLFEIVYRFYTLEGGDSLVVKVRVPRSKPLVPSLTPIWPGATFHEREGYDLYGIRFKGHPYPKRIYMWEEFKGFPMRKDFPRQGDKYLPE